MHVMIATREDPLLPLSRLRARGQLIELRAADLRFTPDEASEFLNKVMGLDLTKKQVAALERRTEGWIAGLQLAAISMQGSGDAEHFVKSFTGSNRYILDYLIEEVLEQCSQEIQSFLMQTSLLDRLSGPLCDALTGQVNGQSTLESLEHTNLFIIPLDDERHWYRYHHLFQDLLQRRLRQTHAKQIPALHQRASEWYEKNGFPSQAIRHAFANNDFKRVAILAESAWPTWEIGYQPIEWLGWVKDLPDEFIHNRPMLSLAYAWAFINSGMLEDADMKLKAVERWLELEKEFDRLHESQLNEAVGVDPKQLQAILNLYTTARAYHAQAIGDFRATVKHAERALELLPEDDHINRSAIRAVLGLARWANGDLKPAQRFDESVFASDYDLIRGTFVIADMNITLGSLEQAADVYRRAIKVANELDEPVGTEDLYSGFSAVHRERGELDAAESNLAKSKELGEQVELPDWQYRWCIARARSGAPVCAHGVA
jgi:LuxR family maltose regulon positive regulatory protein